MTFSGKTHSALVLFAAMTMSLGASSALAAATAQQNCQAAKNKAAGKYAACMQAAQQKFALNGDAAGLAENVAKCEEKLTKAWAKAEEKATAAGASCLDAPLVVGDFQNVIDDHSEYIGTALAGGGLFDCTAEYTSCASDLTSTQGQLTTCNGNLSTCNGNLTTCNSDLSTCDGNLTTCNSDLSTCDGNLSTCNGNLSTCSSDLSTCNSDLTTCGDDLTTCSDDLAACDADRTYLDGELNVCESDLAVTSADLSTCVADYATCAGDLATCEAENGCGLLGVSGTWNSVFSGTIITNCTTTISLTGSTASFSNSGGGCALTAYSFSGTVNEGTNSISINQPSSAICGGFFTLAVNFTIDSLCDTMTGTYQCVGTPYAGTIVSTR